MMNIYDCFQYFDEDLLLDIRLNILNEHVSKFIISEATYTHNGNKKKLNFNINNFKKFKDKINYIVVDKPPKNIQEINSNDPEDVKGQKSILNGMARDYFQRESLIKGLDESKDNDFILISDLDEIPDLSKVNLEKVKNKIIIFEQNMFYYKLNLIYKDKIWHGSRACKRKYLISPQWLRNIKPKKYSNFRVDLLFSKKKYNDIFFVKNGGWHFTYLKKPEELEKKLLNFAHHHEFERSGLKIDDLKKFIEQRRVVYDHDSDQKKYKFSGEKFLTKVQNNQLPRYINSNLNKYENWLE